MKKLITLFLLVTTSQIFAQSITSWTEENGPLGLGYPVPIPVDTPEPFDGFRTYNGLFTKHQSLALNNEMITGHVVGQTSNNRDIWAYVLSDDNDLTKYGIKEAAMLINGNIHAREWQTPEVLTGIMELLDANSKDQSLHQYLLENTTIIAIPVNNVDGLLQTQRFPTENWYSNEIGPRDGRMRRKNMLNVDEVLITMDDFLLGVDLNRNNNPYWATNPERSSPDETSIVHHGLAAHSEPETLARLNAAELVDAEQLRIYTDVHSFTKVHFSVRTNNTNRTILMRNLLLDFSRHHAAFPAGANYLDVPSGPGGGIGATDEYFANTYQIPAWTLEIEPGNNGGVDYGGFGNDGHDGFILPESEIVRVREQLAQTFMITWYGQAGPPSIIQLRILEKATGILVYDANWDIQADGTRQLFINEVENIIPANEYSLIVSFDKPMRKRDNNNNIVHLQGQNSFALNPNISSTLGAALTFSNPRWVNAKADNAIAYKFYQDDTFMTDFTTANDIVLIADARLIFNIDVADMLGQKLDANPQTVTTWANGSWQGYEDSNGNNSMFGGMDNNYSAPLRLASKNEYMPAVQPTGLYFDPSRSGEGFNYELLENNRVLLQWYTYDHQGKQRWYIGVGDFSANVIVVNELLQTSGGVFGLAFNSENIELSSFGSIEIIFAGGEELNPPMGFQSVSRTAKVLYTDINGKKLRTNMHQLSFVKGVVNHAEPINTLLPVAQPVGLITGQWFSPQRSGEGYLLQILTDGRAVLLVYTYDLTGNHMWLIDSDGVVSINGNDITIDFNNTKIAAGGIFGTEFNAADVVLSTWGTFQFQLSCLGTGTVAYNSIINGFGTASYNITKLTNPLTIPFVCDDE